MGRSGVGNETPGIALGRRRQHHPQLFPGRRRPQRGVDPGQFAGAGGDPQSAAGYAPAGGPSIRPDQHDAGQSGGRRQRRCGQHRIDPLRRGPVRGPEHDHGDSRRERPGRLRRKDPGRDALSRPRSDAGAGAIAARRHEVNGRLQCLSADRRHQAGRDRFRHRQQLHVPEHPGHGEHPPLQRQGNAAYLERSCPAGGFQLHPDQHRSRERPAGGLHPGLPPARCQHAHGGRHPQGSGSGDGGPDLPAGHQPEGRHGPVGLRPPVDREPGAGRHHGGSAVLPGDPDLPGPVADDGDRRVDPPPLRPRRVLVPSSDWEYHQCHDTCRALPGDRPDGR